MAAKYISAIEPGCEVSQPGMLMAPCRKDLLLSGMIKSGSTFDIVPKPEQVGQAPNGLLKENILGVNSSMLMPQSGQA